MADAYIRKGFISAILGIFPEEIEETELMQTHLRKQHAEDKLGILDVRVRLNNQIQMNLEMQVLPFEYWQERLLFYLCKIFTDQIEEGEGYELLEKCIHVGILDFILFQDCEEYVSCFHLWEDKRKTGLICFRKLLRILSFCKNYLKLISCDKCGQMNL